MVDRNEPSADEWPEERKYLAFDVWRGLLDGDLAPLARALRAGYPIDEPNAKLLAEMIEHSEDSLFHIVVKGRQRGQRTWTELTESHEQKIIIGVFVERRLRDRGKGQFDAIVKEATEKYGVGKTTVTDALAHLRKTLEAADTAPGSSLLQYYFEFYSD